MNSTIRKVVFFVFLVGLSYLAYEFMIKQANRDLAEKRARVEQKLAKLREFEETTARTEDLNKQVQELQEAVKFFESRLPSTSEIHKVLEQITVIAQKEGLTPKTIKTLKAENNSGYVEQPLKMQLVGNFNAFYSYLLELEKLPRIMKIRELKLGKQPKDEGQISADFIISIFFQNS